jgi:hypothetical protein
MSSPTVTLISKIVSILRTVHSGSFYLKASNTVPYPYITFKISEIGDSMKLELDYWTNSKDSTSLETLADSIYAKLHKYTETNSDLSITIYKNGNRQRLDEDSIQRINETYEIRYYGKEE